MTPGARLAAAIAVLEDYERSPAPADAIVASYLRTRRYIGAKDRAAIQALVFDQFRQRARLDWHIARTGLEPTPRLRIIAGQAFAAQRALVGPRGLFTGTGHDPAPLDPAEERLFRTLAGKPLDDPAMPEAVRVECPEWAETGLREALGDRFAEEMTALIEPAPLDLRANAIKADRDAVMAALAEDGVAVEPTPWSPWGLRRHGRIALGALPSFRAGLFEVQDEGSQLIAVVADARPGMQVVDFCAGAGGKTLALAATMANKGRIVACDVSADRLERAGERLRRAGVHNVERRPLKSERDPWVKRHKARFDRVVVDAPCSGTGTWRRNPDARWRPAGPGLETLMQLQARILESAARLVKPGGRLIYATCSLMRAENEDQIAHFLAGHADFALRPIAESQPGLGDRFMRLTPASHGTDGFFAAILERAKEAPSRPDGETP